MSLISDLDSVPLRLTRNNLYAAGETENLPLGMYRYLYDGHRAKTDTQSQIVILAGVLSDEVNRGYDFYGCDVIREVNGRQINSMRDLVAAFEENQSSDFHKVVLGRPENTPSYIVLSAPMVKERDQSILERYRIPAKASPGHMNKVAVPATN